MSWGKAIGEVFGAFNFWRKGRRGRIRETIIKLEEKKKRIMKQAPTAKQARRAKAIILKIKHLETILNQE